MPIFSDICFLDPDPHSSCRNRQSPLPAVKEPAPQPRGGDYLFDNICKRAASSRLAVRWWADWRLEGWNQLVVDVFYWRAPVERRAGCSRCCNADTGRAARLVWKKKHEPPLNKIGNNAAWPVPKRKNYPNNQCCGSNFIVFGTGSEPFYKFTSSILKKMYKILLVNRVKTYRYTNNCPQKRFWMKMVHFFQTVQPFTLFQIVWIRIRIRNMDPQIRNQFGTGST